jgi:hypothetical protein
MLNKKECLTLAASCNYRFRRNYLKEDTIALIHPRGHSTQSNASRSAMEWLKFVSHRDNITIQHEKNGGEFRIPSTNFYVDGINHEKKLIFEYNGNKTRFYYC